MARETFFIDFSPFSPRTAEICFIFSPFFSSCSFFTLQLVYKLPRYQTDKKIISNEHFALRDNELLIRNAVKHLSGYYSCVVQFMNSGAKLETPHELINIVCEYHTITTYVDKWARCIKTFRFSLKLHRFSPSSSVCKLETSEALVKK